MPDPTIWRDEAADLPETAVGWYDTEEDARLAAAELQATRPTRRYGVLPYGLWKGGTTRTTARFIVIEHQ